MFTKSGKVIATKAYKNKQGEYKADSVVVETENGFVVSFAPLGTFSPGENITVVTACEGDRWVTKFVR